jgi:hypothetical protein
MRINRDGTAFSSIIWGLFFTATCVGCAVQGIEWIIQGQRLRGAVLLYLGSGMTGFGAWVCWKGLIKD